MSAWKKKNLRRPIPFMTRFNADERKRFNGLVAESGLTYQEYGRCRLLYIPFAAVGGNEPSSKSTALPGLPESRPAHPRARQRRARPGIDGTA